MPVLSRDTEDEMGIISSSLSARDKALYMRTRKTGQKEIVISAETDVYDLASCAELKSMAEINALVKNADDRLQILNTLKYLMHANIKLDVTKTLVDRNSIKMLMTADASIDLDSVMIILTAPIQENVLDMIKAQLDDSKKHCDVFKSDSDLCLNVQALAVVMMADTQKWIRSSDMQQVVGIESQKFVPLCRIGTPSPTVGFKFHPLHEEKKSTFLLPIPENSDPIRGWIRINSQLSYDKRMEYLKVYKACVREIAAAICFWYKPANYYYEIEIFASKEEKKGGKCLGGMWIHRLAFLLFQIRLDETDPWVLALLEETYNGKARCSSVMIENFNLNGMNESSRETTKIADDLAEKVFDGKATDFSILRLHAMNIASTTLVLGLGLQHELLKEAESGNTKYYTCRAPKTHTNDLDNTDWVVKHYTTGALCEGIAGFTETNKYTDYLLTCDTKLLPTIRKGFDEGLKTANAFHSQEQGKGYVKLRLQQYYNSWRYSMNESIVPYADRLSTKLQYCNNIRHNALFNPESTEECVGDVNISTLYRNLLGYNTALAENMSRFQRKPGNRVETAFAVKMPIRLNWSAADGSEHAGSEHAFDAKYISCLLKGPIQDVLTEAKRSTRIILLEDVVAYTTRISNAYTFLYEICLNKLQDALPPVQINCICIFLKYIQDFLSILYSGHTKPSLYKCEASNIMRKYNYTVFAKKLANGLNRPYCLLPTLPAIVREYLGAYSFGDQKYREGKKLLLDNRGFILTQPLNSKESMERKRKFDHLVKNGHGEGTGKLAVCANDKCNNRYHFSVNALHHHLNISQSCKSSYVGDTINEIDNGHRMESMSLEVVAHMHSHIESKCITASPEHEKALKFVREGKAVYISGDGGAGKSYLARLLFRQLLMIHGDWKIHKSGRNKVFGVAFQGIACTNMGTSFTSIHKFLEIDDFHLIKNEIDENIREFCQERINNSPVLRNKLRMTEAMIIDEVGMIHDILGRYLVTFLKVARENDLAFGGIQVIVLGQLTQGLPVEEKSVDDALYKQRSWGASDEVNHNTHHIQLSTLYRSGNDPKLQELIKKAKHGELTEEDIGKIKSDCGKNVRSCLESSELAKRQGVISLYYEVGNVRTSNMNFITINKDLLRTKHKLQQVFAKDYLPTEVEKDDDIYAQESCATDEHGELLNRRIFGGDWSDMYLYIGMPVVLTKNIWASDYTKECNLAKGAQGTITEFSYAADGSNDIDEVFISFKLTTDDGHDFIYKMSTKRQLGYYSIYTSCFQRGDIYYKDRMRLRRKMFPFTYGKDLSWSSIQGLTLKKVVLNLPKNKIVTCPNRKFSVAGLFYIALSRVSSLDDFMLIWPADENRYNNIIKYYMKFMNTVDEFSVKFEKNWVKKAMEEQDEYIIKAQDSIALLDMQRDGYFTKYMYHPEVQKASEKETETLDKNASQILYMLWYFFMFAVHFEYENGFMFETEVNNLKLYKMRFRETVKNAKLIQPLTEMYQQLKALLLENISGFFHESKNDEPIFERMTKSQYLEEGGKDRIAILKNKVFVICSLLKEYTAEKTEEYEKTFITPNNGENCAEKKEASAEDIQCNNTTTYISDADCCKAVEEFEREEEERFNVEAVKIWESMNSPKKDVQIAEEGAERVVGQKQRTTHRQDETDQRTEKKKCVKDLSKTFLQGCSITVQTCLLYESVKGRRDQDQLYEYILGTLKNKALSTLHSGAFAAVNLNCFCPEPARVQKVKYSVVHNSHYICSKRKCNFAVDVNATQLPVCRHCIQIWTTRRICTNTHNMFSSFANILIESVGHSETYCTRRMMG